MSQRPFWRWLLLDKEWAWISRRPLWQYLLLHWARAVLGGLTALAVVAPLLHSFSPFSFVVWYIVGATLGTVFVFRPVGGDAARRKCIPRAVTPRTDAE